MSSKFTNCCDGVQKESVRAVRKRSIKTEAMMIAKIVEICSQGLFLFLGDCINGIPTSLTWTTLPVVVPGTARYEA